VGDLVRHGGARVSRPTRGRPESAGVPVRPSCRLLRGANEVVVPMPSRVPGGAEPARDLEPVLVGAGDQPGRLAAQPVRAGQRVSDDGAVRVPDVRDVNLR
jgi:hypothetical protein